MTIYYIGPFRFPVFDAAAARVMNNARLLRDLGHEVLVISWGGSALEEDLCEDGRFVNNGIEYLVTGELDCKGNILQKYLIKQNRGDKTMKILAQRPKPDIIIIYNARFRFSKIMYNFCKENRIKLVHDITEWYDKSDMHIDDYIPNYINMHFYQKKIANKICISRYLAKYYNKSHNIIIPATCDSKDSKWSKDIDPQYILPQYDGITLIYAGNPVQKDCVHSVINVINKLSIEGYSLRFIILGITRDQYLYNYKKKLDTTKFSPSIIFVGRVPQQIIPQFYKQADFMILFRKPTRKNMAGFPTKFAESLISGTPVIANNTSDLSYYLKSGYNGFLVNDYKEDSIRKLLKEKVLKLSKEDIEELKKNAKKSSSFVDYRYYFESMSHFLDNLE